MSWTQDDQDWIEATGARDHTGYISGPMRGYDLFNFPAFHAAQAYLEKRGWYIYSPASMDQKLDGFNGEGEWTSTLEEALRRDFSVICRSGAMFLLKGWEQSTGANAELWVARTLKLSVYEFTYDDTGEITGYEPLVVTTVASDEMVRLLQAANLRRLEDAAIPAARAYEAKVMEEMMDAAVETAYGHHTKLTGIAPADEHRVVDPVTGGAKGSKLPRFDLVPPDAMLEVAKVYGIGSKKYEDRNWERGYAWGLSYAALERHLNADKRGEDLDPEGFYHLAAVAWHALALLAFRLRSIGTDDRGNVTYQGQNKAQTS